MLVLLCRGAARGCNPTPSAAAAAAAQLVYYYLTHHADANATCRELALLAINSFQRDLADQNQLIRAMALRVMTSIRVRDIVQIQLMAIKKCATDPSPYVRKTACAALPKVHALEPEQKAELVVIIEPLLGDGKTMVLSAAMMAFSELCPERLDLLHAVYRKLCHMLADLDEWGQMVVLDTLTRYARTQFTDPRAASGSAGRKKPSPSKAAKKKKPKSSFYSDEEEEEEEEEGGDSGGEEEPSVDPDHALLLSCSLPLLRSRNTGVVLAVAALHHYAGGPDPLVMTRVGRALVRCMRNHREIQYVLLANIVTLAGANPGMFRPYLRDFFVTSAEPAFVRRQKLRVLACLADEANVAVILREFTNYVKDADKEFVCASIVGACRIATAVPSIVDRVLRGLMGLVGSSSDAVVAEAVVAIRQLVQQHPDGHDAIIVRLVRTLEGTRVAAARAAVVWIIGDFLPKPKIARLAPDALRLLAKSFKDEALDVKLQVLNLAAKMVLRMPDSQPVALLHLYVVEMARYDTSCDVRDRARWLRALTSSTNEAVRARAHAVLLGAKAAPMVTSADGTGEGTPTLAMATLSHIVGHTAAGYVPVPAWRTEPAMPSLRQERRPAAAPAGRSGGGHAARGGGGGGGRAERSSKEKGFYASEGEESDRSGSGSGSGSEDESGSASGSGSDASESEGEGAASGGGAAASGVSPAPDDDSHHRAPAHEAAGEAPGAAAVPLGLSTTADGAVAVEVASAAAGDGLEVVAVMTRAACELGSEWNAVKLVFRNASEHMFEGIRVSATAPEAEQEVRPFDEIPSLLGGASVAVRSRALVAMGTEARCRAPPQALLLVRFAGVPTLVLEVTTNRGALPLRLTAPYGELVVPAALREEACKKIQRACGADGGRARVGAWARGVRGVCVCRESRRGRAGAAGDGGTEQRGCRACRARHNFEAHQRFRGGHGRALCAAPRLARGGLRPRVMCGGCVRAVEESGAALFAGRTRHEEQRFVVAVASVDGDVSSVAVRVNCDDGAACAAICDAVRAALATLSGGAGRGWSA